jgi:hypothetical protein
MYTCWGCRERFERDDGEWFCPPCMPKWDAGEIEVNVYTIAGETATKGYAGYNHGLGIEIQNKGHWQHEVNKRGLRTVEIGEVAANNKHKRTEALNQARTEVRQVVEKSLRQHKVK